jgi:PAS domain S-box-containing protein
VRLDALVATGQLDFTGRFHATANILQDFLSFALQLTAAVHRFHEQGTVHGAITPAVVVVDSTGAALQLLAGVTSSDHWLAYAAPEQTGRMDRWIDQRTDLYALGVIFYQLLTGQLPFSASDPLSLVHALMAGQPPPPAQLRPDLPVPVSEIITRLLARDPRDRYQSADGLARDLAHCQTSWQSSGRIEPFALGQSDVPDRLLLPQTLYGRGRELDRLLHAFDEACHGAAQLLLVSGDSGVGKTALVSELFGPVVAAGGTLIFAKADDGDQQRAAYGAAIYALEDFVDQLLASDPDQLAPWRDKLALALSGNTAQIVRRIPGLAQIIETPSDVPTETSDPKSLLTLALQSLVRAIADANHPLVMILDDAQYADTESWQLVRDLTTDSDLHLLVICTCRRNEETDDRLSGYLASIPAERHLALTPLELADTGCLLADALRTTPEQVKELASLIQGKTGGNAFFLREFLRSLNERNLVLFDPQARAWQWDLAGIQATPMMDNVVELVQTRLQRLPEQAQTTLKIAAMMGSRFDVVELSAACRQLPGETSQDLRLATHLGALAPVAPGARRFSRPDWPSEPRLATMEQMAVEYLAPGGRDQVTRYGDLPLMGKAESEDDVTRQIDLQQLYEFTHMQIREAATLLLPELAEETLHMQIGRGLLQNMTAEQQQKNSLRLVRHLNQAPAALVIWSQRVELAELNLQAGRQVLALAAYESAFSLTMTGMTILIDDPDRDPWQQAYDLMRDLHLTAAQAAVRNGQFEMAEELLGAIDQRSQSALDSAATSQVRMFSFYLQGNHAEACNTAIDALRRLGVRLPAHPRNRDVLAAMARTRLAMLGRPIGSLADLPPMTDEHRVKAMELMAAATISAASVEPKLLMVIGLEMVWQTVKHGLHPLSAMGYALHGVLLAGVLDRIDAGYAFGQLALGLAPQIRSKEYRVFVEYFVNAHISHWKEPVAATLQPLRDLASTGEFEYLAVAAGLYSYFTWLIDGRDIATHEQSIAENLHLLEPFRETPLHYRYLLGLQYYQNLLGRAADPCQMIGDAYDERRLLPLHQRENDRTTLFYLACHQLILSYLFGCYDRARDAARLAAEYRDGGAGTPLIPVLCFYDSLACLARYPSAQGAEAAALLQTAAVNQRKLRQWARLGPANHQHRCTLVEAEQARVAGDHAKARELYDDAIRQAQDSDYLMELAVTHELAARFYLAIDQPAYAATHLRAAHGAYRTWGALGKVQQLENAYPQVFRGAAGDGAAGLAGLSAYLDMASVLKAAQVLSSETNLPLLLDKLTAILIENAGAQFGYLLLPDGNRWRVAAGGPAGEAGDQAQPDRPPVAMSIVRQVARSQEPLLINDVAAAMPQPRDPHLLAAQPRSILCLPLLDKGELLGVFYMENRLTRDAFAPQRVQPLAMLASQAAIALTNASLVTGLQEAQDHLQTSEQRFRLLFESAPLGIFEIDIAQATPKILAANRRAEAVYGWPAAELSAMDPTFLIPDESRQAIQRLIETVRAGKSAVLESSNRRRDGTTFPVRIIATPAGDARGLQMIVAVEDISAERQRRSEAEAIDAERLRIAQEIHDGVAQDLAFLRLKVSLWRDWVDSDPDRMHGELDQTQETLDAAIDEIRRSIYALRPLALNEVGLLPALHRYIADFNDQNDVHVDLQIDVGEETLPVDLELPLFRVVQEALNNVIQHAGASLAWVRLDGGGAIHLTIRDNGRGFDVANLSRAGRSGHLGLIQMRERIEQAGGQLTVASEPGRGTQIQVRAPLA